MSLIGLLLLAGVTAWRLSEGPVRLDFLVPHIEKAVNSAGGPLKFRVGGARLAWGGWERTLDILVNDVQAVGADNRLVARIPEMSVTFSARALLQGVVAPTSFDIIGPRIRLVRNESGRMAMMVEEQDAIDPGLFAGGLAALGGKNDPRRPITYLRRISILGARVRLEDRVNGVSWKAPEIDLVLLREDGEIRASMFGAVEIGSTPVRFNSNAAWKPGDSSVDVTVGIEPVRLDRLAALGPRFSELSNFRVPLDGRVSLLMGVDGSIYDGSFEIRAGAGRLVAPELWNAPVDISGATAAGRFNTDPGMVEIERLSLKLGESTATLTARALKLEDAAAINGEVRLDTLALNDLERVWPLTAGASARSWVLGHMSRGVVDGVAATVAIAVPKIGERNFTLDSLSGRLRLRGVSVDYLAGLPPLDGVDATAVFRKDRFIAKVTAGRAAGLDLQGGTVRLTRLDSDSEFASIDVSISGSLPDALSLVDHKPLGYARSFGIDPSKVKGRATTDLKLRMPLARSLRVDQIAVSAAAVIRNATLPSFAFGQSIEEGNFGLTVGPERLTLEGTAKLAGIQTKLRWLEDFRTDAPVVRQYEASGSVDVADLRKFGLGDWAPYVGGRLALDVAYLKPSRGAADLVVKAGLKQASLRMPGFEWRKSVGEDGLAWLAMSIDSGGAAAVRKFDIQARDLRARGQARFAGKGRLQALRLEQFDLGRTRIGADIAVDGKGIYDVALTGAVLDASSFFERFGEDDTSSGLPPLRLKARLGRVWFDPETPIDRLDARMIHDAKQWTEMDLSGSFGDDRSLALTMRVKGTQSEARLTSDNAGAALKAFDIFDTMQGGKLVLSAVRPHDDSKAAWSGSLNISDFTLVKAPLMARILTLASLTGISNTIAGKGIAFASLNVPFVWRDGEMKVRTARAVGSELGLTADGTLNSRRRELALTGTIIPAYTFNSALGNIPIVGKIFSGSEGGGIFAATYQVKGSFEKPDVSVNPLAALAPGFLRNFLEILDGTVGKAVPSKSSAIPEAE